MKKNEGVGLIGQALCTWEGNWLKGLDIKADERDSRKRDSNSSATDEPVNSNAIGSDETSDSFSDDFSNSSLCFFSASFPTTSTDEFALTVWLEFSGYTM